MSPFKCGGSRVGSLRRSYRVRISAYPRRRSDYVRRRGRSGDRLPMPDGGGEWLQVGMNSGETAGQTISHAYVHLIPRRKDDVREPRGGVRGVIPGKAAY